MSEMAGTGRPDGASDRNPVRPLLVRLFAPHPEQKVRALRRMKLIATGAFLAMAAVYFLTEPLGTITILWPIRWDHVNAFAEAAMVGALADWFAVVALFRHPLGIPIWHTAIIPRKKDEIGRNLGGFVEGRLLSIENLSTEIGRFSASKGALAFLADGENRTRAAGWLTDGLQAIVNALDDEQVEELLGDLVRRQLRELDASKLLAGGLEMVTTSGRHHQLLDEILKRVADWLPSRRDMIEEFIERSLERVLRWGRKLIPRAAVDRATDQVLDALIDVINDAARDPNHPLRTDLSARLDEWIIRLRDDPEWIARVNEWKNEFIEHPDLHRRIAGIWAQSKTWLVEDLANPGGVVRGYALKGVESAHRRLESDPELQRVFDERLRQAAITFLSSHHHAIGGLIQRVVDAWDGQQLSRELELNLGRDLQYIRLNGTFIGGLVGLLIHVVSHG